MHPTVEKLLIVQERDQKLRDHHKELARLPVEEEQAKTRLASDLAAVAAAKKAIQENEIAMKNLELDIDTRKNTIIRLKKQQFETRKNEEFAAIGTEITRYGDEVTKLEDAELELMERGETLAATLRDASRNSPRPSRWSTRNWRRSPSGRKTMRNGSARSRPTAPSTPRRSKTRMT